MSKKSKTKIVKVSFGDFIGSAVEAVPGVLKHFGEVLKTAGKDGQFERSLKDIKDATSAFRTKKVEVSKKSKKEAELEKLKKKAAKIEEALRKETEKQHTEAPKGAKVEPATADDISRTVADVVPEPAPATPAPKNATKK